jgi:hypothetical protein
MPTIDEKQPGTQAKVSQNSMKQQKYIRGTQRGAALERSAAQVLLGRLNRFMMHQTLLVAPSCSIKRHSENKMNPR